MFGGGLSTLNSQQQQLGQEVPGGPSDTPTELAWHWGGPQSHALLAASSWDGSVKVWEIQTQAPIDNQPTQMVTSSFSTTRDPVPTITNITGKAAFTHPTPVLSCKIVGGSFVIAGTADKKVMMFNMQTSQGQQIGSHDEPVRRVFFDQKKSLVCSVGWDKNLRWWDTRSPQPAAQVNTTSPIEDADMTESLLACLCQDHNIHCFDLSNLGGMSQRFSCDPLTYHPQCIKLFPDSQGGVIGGTEGRCRVFHVIPMRTKE